MAQEEIKEQDWHSLKAEEVLNHLEVRDEGLSSAEVEKRLEQYLSLIHISEPTRPY